jgi:hypothetical protein
MPDSPPGDKAGPSDGVLCRGPLGPRAEELDVALVFEFEAAHWLQL